MKHLGIALLVLVLMLISMVGFGSINQFEGGEGLAVDALQLQQERTAAVMLAVQGPDSPQQAAALNVMCLAEEVASPARFEAGISSGAVRHIWYDGQGGLANNLRHLNCPYPGGS